MKMAGATAIAIIRRIAQRVRRSMAQFTKLGNGIEATGIERMTASQTASGEPDAPEGTIPVDGF